MDGENPDVWYFEVPGTGEVKSDKRNQSEQDSLSSCDLGIHCGWLGCFINEFHHLYPRQRDIIEIVNPLPDFFSQLSLLF